MNETELILLLKDLISTVKTFFIISTVFMGLLLMYLFFKFFTEYWNNYWENNEKK